MFKKTILVAVDIKYLSHFDRLMHCKAKGLELLLKSKEKNMDYITMVEAIKSGKKATRATWEPGMYVWYGSDMLLHTHPYWPDQQTLHFNNPDGGNSFPYICEKDDGTACDWQLVNA